MLLTSCAAIEKGTKRTPVEGAAPADDAKLLNTNVKANILPFKNLSEDYDSPEKKELLRARIAEFWNAFIKEDYEKVYMLYDPFFRVRTNKYAFMGTLGKIKYHDFAIKEMNFEGNIAKIKIEVSYSIPPTRFRTQEFSAPPTQTEFDETWLYIYDNWYKEFYMESIDMRIVEY